MDYENEGKNTGSKCPELQTDSGLGLSIDPTDTRLQLQNLSIQDTKVLTENDLFAQDEDGDSLLHIAICNEMEDKASRIMDFAQSSEDINLKNKYGQTPLILAVHFGMHKLVRSLIDCGGDVTAVEYCSMNNIIHLAAENKDSAMLKTIFTDSGHLTQDVMMSLISLRDAPNNEGFTPLHIAVKNQDLPFVKILMLLKVNVEAKDLTAGYTALHHAVLTGNADWVKTVIHECSPCLDALSYGGETAYQLAVLNDATEIQKLLADAGANTDIDL